MRMEKEKKKKRRRKKKKRSKQKSKQLLPETVIEQVGRTRRRKNAARRGTKVFILLKVFL